MSVDTPCLAYNEMSPRWELIEALMGGTRCMRAGRTKWLPQEKKESRLDYDRRLERSFLYEGYKDTVNGLGAKPFTEATKILGGTVPEELVQLEQNIDACGNTLTDFARSCFEVGLEYGVGHILTDFPSQSEVPTADVEKKLRPNNILIRPTDLIGWDYEIINGDITLTEIRIREESTKRDNNYRETVTVRIRVITRTEWRLYEKAVGKEWAVVDQGVMTLGVIPLSTFYFGKRSGLLVADPPFEDLAWKNLEHWQSSSDQSNILRFVRCGILFASGFTGTEAKEMTIAPNRIIKASNKDARLSYVEHTGNAIEAGERHLDKLESQMEVLGLRPLVERSNDSTATGKKIDEGRNDCELKTWTRRLSDSLTSSLRFAAQWMNITLPTDLKVDVYRDFSALTNRDRDITNLLSMRKSIPAQISYPTFVSELKRRGFLSEDVDATVELNEISQEVLSASESSAGGQGDSALDLPGGPQNDGSQ